MGADHRLCRISYPALGPPRRARSGPGGSHRRIRRRSQVDYRLDRAGLGCPGRAQDLLGFDEDPRGPPLQLEQGQRRPDGGFFGGLHALCVMAFSQADEVHPPRFGFGPRCGIGRNAERDLLDYHRSFCDYPAIALWFCPGLPPPRRPQGFVLCRQPSIGILLDGGTGNCSDGVGIVRHQSVEGDHPGETRRGCFAV